MAKKRATTNALAVWRPSAAPARPAPINLSLRMPKQTGLATKVKKHAKRAARFVKKAPYDEKAMLTMGAAGLAVGFLEDQFGDMLPEVPFIGRKGALAIGLYLLSKQGIGGQWTRDGALAAASICGYQLGKEGEVSGLL